MNKLHLFAILAIIFTLSCSNDNNDGTSGNADPDTPVFAEPGITVFFGQTHILQPEDDLFGLVSGKSTLLKVNLTDEEGAPAPNVTATLTLNGNTETLTLPGPSTIPAPLDLRPGKIKHALADSYTATISKDWVQPGLNITIKAGEWTKEITNIKIGAPNKIVMRMIDAHFFQQVGGDYPTGWKEELEAKWPTSEIELRRLPNIVFSELTVPPRGGDIIAARVTSKEEYQTITGYSFDGEQATAAQWNRALKAAAGTKGRISLFYTNIYGVPSGGQAGGFAGVGNGTSIGILHHELGHAYSLPHWGNNGNYPYKGDMHGIEAPDIFNKTHAGPTWAYDPIANYLIPPTIQENTIGWKGEVGQYKVDPMQGGGTGSQEQQYLMNHFSDYSVNQMRNYLQGHIVVWNEELGNYARWNDSEGKYSAIQQNNGVNYPVERDVEVISIMAGASSVTPQANIAYPPIGPYTSGIIDLFDPTIAEDRQTADQIYCPDGGCDVSIIVTQGGTTKTYMLPIALDNTLAASDAKSFNTKAINLKASAGTVTQVQLIATPDAEINGVPANPEVLHSWSAN